MTQGPQQAVKALEGQLTDGANAAGGNDPARRGWRLRVAYRLGGDARRRAPLEGLRRGWTRAKLDAYKAPCGARFFAGMSAISVSTGGFNACHGAKLIL